PEEVQVEQGAQLVVRGLLDRADLRAARVVDEHVDVPVTGDGVGDRGLGRRRVGDVERDGVYEAGVLLGELVQRGRAPDGGDHRLARLGRGFGDRPAEAAAGSGDEPDLGVGHWGTPRQGDRSRAPRGSAGRARPRAVATAVPAASTPAGTYPDGVVRQPDRAYIVQCTAQGVRRPGERGV